MPASEIRSSARVAPRSVTRVPATSATTAALSVASDSTQPVQVASPTVRKRTSSVRASSPGIVSRKRVLARSIPSRSITSRRCA